eukprot:scaffold1824_cov172-Pinguiococcus_pyrenoidosus.AAC.1
MVDGGWWMVDALESESCSKKLCCCSWQCKTSRGFALWRLGEKKRKDKIRKSAVLVPAAQACADGRSVGGLEPGFLLSTSAQTGLSPRFYA